MGIHDREYWQDDAPPGLRITGGPRMIVTNLIIITVAIALLDLFTTGQSLAEQSACAQVGSVPPSVGVLESPVVRVRPLPNRLKTAAASGTWG